jgi:hypothetical protein
VRIKLLCRLLCVLLIESGLMSTRFTTSISLSLSISRGISLPSVTVYLRVSGLVVEFSLEYRVRFCFSGFSTIGVFAPNR